jgi:hypothetical protein
MQRLMCRTWRTVASARTQHLRRSGLRSPSPPYCAGATLRDRNAPRARSFVDSWCRRRDSNSHSFRHYPLKIACLPISPRRRDGKRHRFPRCSCAASCVFAHLRSAHDSIWKTPALDVQKDRRALDIALREAPPYLEAAADGDGAAAGAGIAPGMTPAGAGTPLAAPAAAGAGWSSTLPPPAA